MKKLTKRGEWYIEPTEWRPTLRAYTMGLALMNLFNQSPGVISILLLWVGFTLCLFEGGYTAGWRRTK
jgi:hypothetical protein